MAAVNAGMLTHLTNQETLHDPLGGHEGGAIAHPTWRQEACTRLNVLHKQRPTNDQQLQQESGRIHRRDGGVAATGKKDQGRVNVQLSGHKATIT